ncbi:hypothetical protein M9Y10_032615 [Tritrichomonas musculus]|uniref:Histidine acid phosphatase family protein n=1 Tax=Tritrichomonas musculus TaxID=1915356 RepID=A0ABR2H022_9EUKA
MKGWAVTQEAPLTAPPLLHNGKLLSCYLFTRHGARAPLFYWSDYPADELNWSYGESYKDKSVKRRLPIVNGKEYDFSKVPNKGRLLDAGVKQQENLGKLYYNYLSEQTKLLPPSNNYDLSQIYIRSSVIPRAIESAVTFLHGMYNPRTNLEKLSIETGQFGSEILCPNPDLNDFFKQKAKLYSQTPEFQKRISLIPQQIKNSIPDNQVDQLLAGDFPYCLQFNGYRLPKIVEDDNKRYQMMVHSKTECFGSLFHFLNSNIAFYVSGFLEFVGEKAYRPVMELFVSHLKKFLDKKTEVKFTLFSGHDVTLSAFLLSLGIINRDGVSPYASHLAAELWERQNKLLLRFAINGEVLKIKNSETIEVEEFLKKVY